MVKNITSSENTRIKMNRAQEAHEAIRPTYMSNTTVEDAGVEKIV